MANPYVSISDYERVTGTTVACDAQDRVQHMIDTNVMLINRYLGEMANEIWLLYGDPLLLDMVCRATQVRNSVPLGVVSESVGSSSVSYADPRTGLLYADQVILDDLLGIGSRGNRSILVNLT